MSWRRSTVLLNNVLEENEKRLNVILIYFVTGINEHLCNLYIVSKTDINAFFSLMHHLPFGINQGKIYLFGFLRCLQ